MFVSVAALFCLAASNPPPAGIPAAVYTDPAPSAEHPATMEVLHIPSGGREINGVAYLPSGPGPHPVFIFFHGLPGNEKNIDLAQAVRRAGWTAVTVNYRGSWGSPGNYSFAGNLEDARAAIAFVREPANAARLRADPRHIVVAGHSMGGWVAALTAAEVPAVGGAILISAANLGNLRTPEGRAASRDELAVMMADERESLAGTDADRMADELAGHRAVFDWTARARALARTPLLILSSDDGLAADSAELTEAVRRARGRVDTVHVATDHSWSDSRIRLQSEVIRWLEGRR